MIHFIITRETLADKTAWEKYFSTGLNRPVGESSLITEILSSIFASDEVQAIALYVDPDWERGRTLERFNVKEFYALKETTQKNEEELLMEASEKSVYKVNLRNMVHNFFFDRKLEREAELAVVETEKEVEVKEQVETPAEEPVKKIIKKANKKDAPEELPSPPAEVIVEKEEVAETLPSTTPITEDVIKEEGKPVETAVEVKEEVKKGTPKKGKKKKK